MATRSIKLETEDALPPIAAAPVPLPLPSVPAPADSSPEQAKGIATTAEELEAYDIIRRICADSTGKAPIHYLDSVNYFGLNIGKRKKWFMRLFFDGRRKAVVTRIPLERTVPLVPGFEVEAAPENIGKSRVYISSLKDLERLRPLVLLAYEEEIKRSDAAGAEEDEAPAAEAMRH